MSFIKLPVYVLGLDDLWRKGFHILGLNIKLIWVKSGPKFTSQYLSEWSRALICWAGNEKFKQGKTLVSLSAAGLPKILPIILRKELSAFKVGSIRGNLVLRAVLTALSVYRVIGFAPIYKWETITGPFTGSTTVLPQFEIDRVVAHIRPIKHLKKPNFLRISESSGPNYPRATWSSAIDAIALALHPKQMWAWYKWCRHFKWDLPIVWCCWIIIVTTLLLPLIWLLSLVVHLRFPYSVLPFRDLCIGRLATVLEARGKVRVVAIVDYWSQLVLKPLHDSIFRSLRLISQDGTFDQESPMKELLYRLSPDTRIASFDLSAATDRLPVQLQAQILSALGLPGSLWASLLDRDYVFKTKSEDGENVSRVYNYAVGQPMGAYSSWAMLALTHHIIVQIAASRSGKPGWFGNYAIIGDDIIIADDQVASSYLALMNELGVEINMTKSHHGNVAEFAKRWIHTSLGEITPIGAGNILTVVRNAKLMPNLIMDCSVKGYPFIWQMIDRATCYIPLHGPKGIMIRLAVALFCLGPSGILHSGTHTPAEWLGRWASKYYGGSVRLPNLLNAILYARKLDRVQRVDAENARNRKATDAFQALWKRYPLNGWKLSFPWVARISPKAKTLGWLLGLREDMDPFLNRPYNPFAFWRLPWPIQINYEIIFWAMVQRISPGYHAYSEPVEELIPQPPQTSWEHELKRIETIAKWSDRRPEQMEMLVQTSLSKLLRPLDDLEPQLKTEIDWNREVLGSDYVNRTLAMHKLVLELIHPPIEPLSPSLSLTIIKPILPGPDENQDAPPNKGGSVT
jgi:hypothetical protein